MVNLFRQVTGEQGSLTAALLTLLEHSDRHLLREFLRQAGTPFQVADDTELTFSGGAIASPHIRLSLLTQAPGEAWEPPSAAPDTVVVTLAGKVPPGAYALTWEQVDRWLATAAERFDPESRTGFLVRQFREFLGESGIEYFPGFDASLLEEAPAGLALLTSFYQATEAFFDRLTPALTGAREEVDEVRRSRPEDLLSGYCYRDFAGPPFGPTGFLRIAFHLAEAELQVSCWVAPGDGAHGRLRTALLDDQQVIASLRRLEGEPILWLWSPAGEKEIPLTELSAEALASADWDAYQAGIQLGLAFPAIAGEGLVARVGALAEDLVDTLSPVLTVTVH